MSALVAAGAAAAFAGATALALKLSAVVCGSVRPLEDGPRPSKAPLVGLVCGSALVGAALALRDPSPGALGVALIVCAALVASWYSDVRCGIIPDAFTLVPLCLVLAAFGLERQFAPFLSAAIVFAPFAAAAFLTKGFGMGWGDVKLVALGGAVLGLPVALLAFAGACFVAAAVAYAKGRRREPIAFAPYLAASIALGLLVPVFQ